VLVTPALAAVTLGVGVVAGLMGAMLGIGGGVFLVPFLVLVAGVPFKAAAAVSLMAVIATSTSVSAAASSTGRHLINIRLGMVLEVATAAGGVLGGLTAHMLSASTLQMLFGALALVVGIAVFRRAKQEEPRTDCDGDIGRLGGRFIDERGFEVCYRVKRLPVALVVSFVAGNISTLLGVGGGIIKVPVLTTWCGMPMRAAAATSAFMIGVTATSGAIIYYGHGDLIPALGAAAIIGTQAGSIAGLATSRRVKAEGLRRLLASVLVVVALLMLQRGLR
jgi:uncharacterized membrane protein YfcA